MGDVLEKLRDIRTETTLLPQDGSWCFVLDRVLCDSHARIASHVVSFQPCFLSQPFHSALLYLTCAMESPTSCDSTTSSSNESFAHNMWNPLMELLFHVQISSAFEPFVDEIDLAKVALSCHFALDLLCYKEGVHDSA